MANVIGKYTCIPCNENKAEECIWWIFLRCEVYVELTWLKNVGKLEQRNNSHPRVEDTKYFKKR